METNSGTRAAGAIEIRGVRKEYPNGAIGLDKIDLSIDVGELIIFLGPSGSGKTTLLRSIAGLEEITDGEILFDGRVINEEPPEERNVSMVFQDLALYPHMTVRNNIAFPLRAHRGRYSKDFIEKAVEEKASLLGIGHLLDRGLDQLSGGQRQRVALARALVREPIVYLLDEPFSSLDALLRRDFRAEVKRFQRQVGTTVLFVTHDQEDAMTMADRIALFHKGRIVQFDSPRTIFNTPANLFAAIFVGSPQINTASGTLERRESSAVLVTEEGVEIPLPSPPHNIKSGQELTLGVRPQSIQWFSSPLQGKPALPVVVEVLEPISTQTIAHFAGPLGRWAGVFESTEVPAEGDRGFLSFGEEAVHLFDGTTEDAPRITFRDFVSADQVKMENNK